MNLDLLTKNNTKKVAIKRIESSLAMELCQSMDMSLPGSLPSVKMNNLQDKIYFAACRDNENVGVLAITFITLSNIHIDFMAMSHSGLLQSVGIKLLFAAENFCYAGGYSSLTVEVSCPKQNDPTAMLLYSFYDKAGYKPIFDVSSDSNHRKILLQKILGLNDFTFIDLTHSLSSDVPHWGVDVGFKYNARYIQSTESTGDVKFRVQRLEMSAGIGTHMDAPSHCFENAPAIDKIPLQALITLCRVIDVSSKVHDSYSVSADDILLFEEEHGDIPQSAFVIIYTGWDQRWSQPGKYRNEKVFPNVSIEATKLLLSRNIVGIGIDTLSPDAFGSNFPVHELILGSGKYIIENVANAKQLGPVDSFIFALPIKIVDGTEAPIRLIGMKRKRLSLCP
jgi:kynurenine formamidase